MQDPPTYAETCCPPPPLAPAPLVDVTVITPNSPTNCYVPNSAAATAPPMYLYGDDSAVIVPGPTFEERSRMQRWTMLIGCAVFLVFFTGLILFIVIFFSISKRIDNEIPKFPTLSPTFLY